MSEDMRPEIAADFARIYRKGVHILEEACDREKRYSELCTCGRRVQIPYPAIKDITDAMRFLADQGVGRPAQQPAKPAPVKTTGNISTLTDDELEAVLAQGETTG